MIVQFRYFLNVHTNKGTGRNKEPKVSLCSVWVVTNLKTARKQQKDEHDQSGVKIPPKSTLGFIFVKENWKERQSKTN